jgi:RND superfamily putative drug exporter
LIERWTRAVLRYRYLVLAGWLAIAVIGAVSAIHLPSLLLTSLSAPGTSSAQADGILARHFGDNPEGTFTVVFRSGKGHAQSLPALTRRVREAARAIPNAHALPLQTAPGIVYGAIATEFDLQRAQDYTGTLRHALAGPGLPAASVTGAPAIQHDINPVLAGDLSKGELLAVPIALLVLAMVLGVRAVLLVPLVFAGTTITAALAVIYAIAHVILMASYVPNLVELIGLGLAIDYSLLVVHRYLEEIMPEDVTVEDAMVRTMMSAGRSVLFSGAAVAIGLAAVLIMPVPFIRSLGIAGIVVPLTSILAALTVQPVMLFLLGRRGTRALALPGLTRQRNADRTFWAAVARLVTRRRVLVSVVAGIGLAACAAPVVWLQLSPGSFSGIPQFVPSAGGLALLRDSVGPGALTPIDVVADGGTAGQARSGTAAAAELRLGRALLQDPEVFVVSIGSKPPFVDPTGRYGRIMVSPRHAFGDGTTQQLVDRLRSRDIRAAHFPPGFTVSTGGAPSEGVDFLDRVYAFFPWIVVAALALAYIILLRAFRSLLLPMVALLLDLLSVAAACGVLVLVFRFGLGAGLFGLDRSARIEGWIPVFLFATLFGLSMDYQVFLVTRTREARDRGAIPDAAIAYGIERTGRIVSAAAVIMIASFSGLIAGRIAGLQQLGVGLAVGVFLDATVVRILLMPGLMALLGPRCWWLPASIARLALVEASPLPGAERRGLSRGSESALTSQQ